MPLIHTFHTSMCLPLPRDTVFAFFAEATHLARMTPPELGFEMLTPQPMHLREGTRINYRLHLFGVPFSWQSQIQRWNPPEAFVDVQLHGPYKHWVHTHRFREEDGMTIIEDEVHYALPYWPFGELVMAIGAEIAPADPAPIGTVRVRAEVCRGVDLAAAPPRGYEAWGRS